MRLPVLVQDKYLVGVVQRGEGSFLQFKVCSYREITLDLVLTYFY
jgi:hypothetical protein